MSLFLKEKRFFVFIVTILFSFHSFAQPYETAVDYMDHISKANMVITEKYLVYLSGMSHGKSARKVEKRRMELVQLISNTRFDIRGMPPYKGDKSFRDTTVAYLKILDNVFNEDYGKIVNMEEIAEQSYDAMEAYMMAKDKATEKLHEASEKQHEMQKQFAAKNNVTLIESQSEMDAKMKSATDIMNHYDEVYLVFFKSYKQEGYLIDAMNQKNISSIEQNINSLKKFTEDGMAKLKEMKGYNGDASLIIAGRNMLSFYKTEAAKASYMTDFFLQEESFNKLKKQFDAKPGSRRTKQDVDQFNKAVNDINAASKNFNTNNADFNKQRSAGLDGWDKAVKNFLDNYIPVQRR